MQSLTTDYLSGIFKPIENELGQVKELMLSCIVSDASEEIVKMMDSVCGAMHGKMLRSGLVLLSGLCCGGISQSHIRIAAITEMIHNATLFHDDVMDDGRERRGMPTINRLFGNESAVLLGDFLLTRVLRMCVDLEPRIIRIISDSAGEICKGEINQITQRRNFELSEEEYIDIITRKSAIFFSNCCYSGALLSQANESTAKALAEFGLNVGIAFQIVDDLLDIIGDKGKTGKTPGRDFDKNKLTLAVIHLLRTVSRKEKETITRILSSDGKGRDRLAGKLKSCGSVEYSYNCAKEYAEAATASLINLHDSNAKEALIETANFVVKRMF